MVLIRHKRFRCVENFENLETPENPEINLITYCTDGTWSKLGSKWTGYLMGYMYRDNDAATSLNTLLVC